MRSSDWSSDVCSSDLGGTLEIPVDAVPQVASEGDLGDLRLDVHLHRHHVQALDHVADRLPRARGGAHQQGVGFVDRRHADAVALDLEGDAGIAVLARIQAQRRSEEHTSELQSLMRISYAVFCLKKKTITKNQRYITTPNERQ